MTWLTEKMSEPTNTGIAMEGRNPEWRTYANPLGLPRFARGNPLATPETPCRSRRRQGCHGAQSGQGPVLPILPMLTPRSAKGHSWGLRVGPGGSGPPLPSLPRHGRSKASGRSAVSSSISSNKARWSGLDLIGLSDHVAPVLKIPGHGPGDGAGYPLGEAADFTDMPL